VNDLRALFQWAADHNLPVLEATRTHLELYRTSMEGRGLAASTVDRRLSTACGFYRFAHIDGRISSNPAQQVRRPTVLPSEGRGLDRGELARLLFTAERFDHAHAALAVLLGLNGLRVPEACGANIEAMGHGGRPSGPAHRREGLQAGPHSLDISAKKGHRARRPPGCSPSLHWCSAVAAWSSSVRVARNPRRRRWTATPPAVLSPLARKGHGPMA
jgi:site-specific recombinase XerC